MTPENEQLDDIGHQWFQTGRNTNFRGLLPRRVSSHPVAGLGSIAWHDRLSLLRASGRQYTLVAERRVAMGVPIESMKVLIVSPTPTHPADAGNRVRIKTLMEQLQLLGHAVHFAHVEMDVGDHAAMVTAWGGAFHRIPYRRPPPRLGWRLRRAVSWRIGGGRWYYWRIDDWYDRDATSALAQLQRRERFDAVIVEYVFFSRAFDAVGGDVLKILDTHDVMADRHLQFVTRGDMPKWFSTTRREEARGLARADVVLAVQDRERAYLESAGAKRVVVVGHVVEVALPRSAAISRPRPTVLFVGSANDLNVTAVRSFVAETWPLVRRRLDATLVLAGGVCDRVPDAESRNQARPRGRPRGSVRPRRPRG